ncbi:polysaccharide biosynthesis/export family protein [Aquifex sp.]
MLSQSGPTTAAVLTADEQGIVVLPLNPEITFKLKKEKELFRKKLKAFLAKPYSPKIGKGDILEIYIYETPPAVFLSSLSSQGYGGGVVSAVLPPQIVDDEGYINIPFVGRVKALGKRPEEISREIERKLAKIANHPQVIVKVSNFTSSTVTVLGHVKESRRVPLGYNTKTLLDVLANVGGVTSPINKTIVKIIRKGQSITLPLEDVLSNPHLNINLKPGDIINVIYKTKSATILGATGRNMELEFEAKGISLSQALGRAGGLRDDIAHAKGLFVFRFEKREILDSLGIKYKVHTKDGRVPVVYRLDLSDPVSVFLLKEFELKDGDIVYVSTAPAVQLGKFLSMIRDIIQPIFMIKVLSR